MARRPPHHNMGHSSDNDGTASSVSFRLDPDNAAGVDFPINITDVTTLTSPIHREDKDKKSARGDGKLY